MYYLELKKKVLANKGLIDFIELEKSYFLSLNTGINWEDERWNVENWLFHRAKDKYLVFKSNLRIGNKLPFGTVLPEPGPLPHPYIDFVKALVVYFKRTKDIGYIAIRNYVIECRRLYIILFNRNEHSPHLLTRWHFEQTISLLKHIEYKNLFDAATYLQSIADLIDSKGIVSNPLGFRHDIKSSNSYYQYESTKSIDLNERTTNEKLPSYEALVAYAKCTNNPINDNEEILLRTIDLLIAMGLRGNEVTYIPIDCWVEKKLVDSKGNVKADMHGNPLMSSGIRYYAEKQFQSRVHWLAKQDIPLAKRAVERLIILTEEVREIAKWQEDNPNRLWKYNPNDIISDIKLIKLLGFEELIYLRGYLKRLNVLPIGSDRSARLRISTVRNGYSKLFRVGQVEQALLKKLKSHDVLKEKVSGESKIVLKTSDILSIRFDGAFRFKRKANVMKVFPERTGLKEINAALGSISSLESIFQRRSFTEADGSKIILTSHQPRHWRNTLYELAGMSNVQQALAMGRQNLTQNKAYQHTTPKERTKLNQEFISFNSVNDKITFLHEGVRSKSILGEITDTYHFLKKNQSIDSAELFLNTHGLAIHITPFGGCTHDFSQSPCQKHLQCWNGCSHLHRTNTPGETVRIKEQLDKSKSILKKVKSESLEEQKNDVWVKDLEKKIKNLEKAVKIRPTSPTPIQLFPKGPEITKPKSKRKNSSV